MRTKGLNFRISGTNNAGPALQALNSQIGRVNATTQTNRALQASWNRGLNENRRMVQQFGFQLGDFATQIAGGQDAMLAFVQQGGQILQFFGPFGAVAAAALAVFGSLGLAMYKSGVAASQVTPILGVLQEELSMIVSALKTLADVFIDIANIIVNEIDTIIIALGLLAGYALGGYIARVIMASTVTQAFAANMASAGVITATFRLGLDMVALSARTAGAALMRLLPYAILTLLALAIQRFWQLKNAVGGFGAAFGLVWNLFKAVVVAIVKGVGALKHTFVSLGHTIEAAILRALAKTGAMFIEWQHDIADIMNSTFNMNIQYANASEFGRAIIPSLHAAEDAATAAAGRASSAWQGAADGVAAAWKPISDMLNDTRVDVRDWFGGNGEGKDGGGKDGKPTKDQLTEEAQRIEQIFQQISSSITNTMLSGFKAVVAGTKSLKDFALESLNSVLDAAQDVLLSPIFDMVGRSLGNGLLNIFGFPSFGGPTSASIMPATGKMITPSVERSAAMIQNGGKSVDRDGRVVELRIIEDEGFAARVEAVSDNVAVKRSREAVAQYDRKILPSSVKRTEKKGRVR